MENSLREHVTTLTVKVWGREGHRQRESFNPSVNYDWSDADSTRTISVMNSDVTGTNDYTIVCITRNSLAECYSELDGQLSDGVFENSRYGKVETLSIKED